MIRGVCAGARARGEHHVDVRTQHKHKHKHTHTQKLRYFVDDVRARRRKKGISHTRSAMNPRERKRHTHICTRDATLEEILDDPFPLSPLRSRAKLRRFCRDESRQFPWIDIPLRSIRRDRDKRGIADDLPRENLVLSQLWYI